MEGSCEECRGDKEVWGDGVGDVLRVRRLGWFRHVVRRGERRSWERLRVLWRPPERPKKTWRRNMQEELAGGAGGE